MPDVAPSPIVSGTNVPIALTSFVGRESELADVMRLLSATRLLTMTGAGGCGKTRLALEVASRLMSAYADGVWLVELASLTDPSLVAQAVATPLGVREQPSATLLTTLVAHLQAHHLLLILDNCEHLLDACAEVVDALLRGSSRLQVLATSREPLGIAGEVSWRVPSLPMPPMDHTPPLEQLTHYAAVRLFLDRARAALPSFALTPHNAPAVVQVCRHLDGIPLAIELAAARMSGLTAEQLAMRLDQRFRLLTGGSRRALPRQQTLRATVAWSEQLLNAPERLLFHRLAVFAGGWTLEAAEAVCAGEGIATNDVLDLLLRLVSKSMVLAEEEGGEARYRLLETLRQYARERLAERAEVERVQQRHASYYLELAETAEQHMWSAAGEWLARLEKEYDNLRAALGWAASSEEATETGVRLAGALAWFWWARGSWSEGRRWLVAALAAMTHVVAPARIKVLMGLGMVEREQGNNERAVELLDEALTLTRTVGDPRGIIRVLLELAYAVATVGDESSAATLSAEGLALARAAGDTWGTVHLLTEGANFALSAGDYERARAMNEESLRLVQELDAPWSVAYVQTMFGLAEAVGGDLVRAEALLEESLAQWRVLKSPFIEGFALLALGHVAWRRGDQQRAVHLWQDCLGRDAELRSWRPLVLCLVELALVAGSRGAGEQAARLLGAAEALSHGTAVLPRPRTRAEYEQVVAGIRAHLGEIAFAAAAAAGRALPLEQVIAEALTITAVSVPTSQEPGSMLDAQLPAGLTTREGEVVVLLASGLSNRQIAEALSISERTVSTHVTNILGKLGLMRRAQVALWAVEHGLVMPRRPT